MPIKPENRDRYPADWPVIRAAILERAKNHCEWCGVRNHAFGYRRTNGDFIECEDAHEAQWMEDAGLGHPVRVVLTIAHLDHVPEHCEPENLRAWCQRCHLAYDAVHHAQSRYQSRRAGAAIADLFSPESL